MTFGFGNQHSIQLSYGRCGLAIVAARRRRGPARRSSARADRYNAPFARCADCARSAVASAGRHERIPESHERPALLSDQDLAAARRRRRRRVHRAGHRHRDDRDARHQRPHRRERGPQDRRRAHPAGRDRADRRTARRRCPASRSTSRCARRATARDSPARRSSATRTRGRKCSKQGEKMVFAHAIQGIRGMPPKGGNPELPDDEVHAAVVHMVNAVGANWKVPPRPARLPLPHRRRRRDRARRLRSFRSIIPPPHGGGADRTRWMARTSTTPRALHATPPAWPARRSSATSRPGHRGSSRQGHALRVVAQGQGRDAAEGRAAAAHRRCGEVGRRLHGRGDADKVSFARRVSSYASVHCRLTSTSAFSAFSRSAPAARSRAASSGGSGAVGIAQVLLRKLADEARGSRIDLAARALDACGR